MKPAATSPPRSATRRTTAASIGHKPTYGLCPLRGHSLGEGSAGADISVIGPLARSASDLAPALAALAGPDDIDGAGARVSLPAPRKTKLKDFKIGVILNDPVSEVDPAVQDVLQRLTDFLVKQKAKVSTKARPALDMAHVQRTFALMLAAATSYRLVGRQIRRQPGCSAKARSRR